MLVTAEFPLQEFCTGSYCGVEKSSKQDDELTKLPRSAGFAPCERLFGKSCFVQVMCLYYFVLKSVRRNEELIVITL